MAKQKKSMQDGDEREYVVPLRKQWLKVPKYRRAEKAVKALKEFLAKHLRVEDRDIRKIKLDHFLNEEVWAKGMRKPFHKIKVKVKKDKEVYRVYLSEIPEFIKYKMDRENKSKEAVSKVKEKKKAETPAEQAEETDEEKKDAENAEEKKEASKESMQEMEKQIHKQSKHEQTSKKPPKIRRMALQK